MAKNQHQSIEARISYLCAHNKDGSHGTRQERLKHLSRFGRDLQKKYRMETLKNFSLKHVKGMIQVWKDDPKVSANTIHNYIGHVRWLAEKLGKYGMIPRRNKDLDIPPKEVDYNTDKAWTPKEDLIQQLPERQSITVELMHEFGLRHRESLMFRPGEGDRGDRIYVEYGTKGGLERFVPIETDKQREVLARALEFTKKEGTNNLIGKDRSLKSAVQQSNNIFRTHGMYRREDGGLGTAHGLRHAYAQRQYEKMTGLSAPCKLTKEERVEEVRAFTREQRELVNEKKMDLSQWLGHGRTHICHKYIGSYAS